MSDLEILRARALEYPDAAEEFPWGDRVVKVGGKIFVFLNHGDDGVTVTLKLRASHGEAMTMPFIKPTGYNLGRAGWVTARFEPDAPLPVSMIGAWIDESYRLVAPKRLVKRLDASGGAAAGR
jgi:predicted DNA-binding protein (MmcQ/YjbR family)